MRIMKSRKNKGFSLGEILIVILIIAILVVLSVPHFIKARDSNVCVGNLEIIYAAKIVYFKGHPNQSRGPVTQETLKNGGYLKEVLRCPDDGTYDLGKGFDKPMCSEPGHKIPANF